MRKILFKIMMVVMMLMPLVVAEPVMAAKAGTCTDACIKTNLLFNTYKGSEKTGQKCYCAADPTRGSAIQEMLIIVVNIFSGLAMSLAVVGILIAGIQYLTARDNEAQVTKAKNRLLQIVIGMLVFALMWGLLNWLVPGGVLNSASGA